MDSFECRHNENRFRDVIVALNDFLTTPTSGSVQQISVSEVVQSLINMRRSRAESFSSRLFGDPAWDIILDLYLSESRGKRVSVSSACIASETSPTTGLRYLRALESEKIIERVADPNDGRRIYVSLTGRGRSALEEVVANYRLQG